MHDTAFRAEQRLCRTAIFFILLDCIIYILLGELIFQLHSDDRQPVQKNAEVKCEPCIGTGILELSCHAEYILFIQLCGIRIISGRTHEKEVQCFVFVLHAVAEQFYYTVAPQLLGELLKEPLLFEWSIKYMQFLQLICLSILQKAEKPCFINSDLTVIVGIIALFVIIMLCQPVHDQRFKAVFLDVDCHDLSPHFGYYLITDIYLSCYYV